MEVKQPIREFIARNLLFSGDVFPHSDDASFLEEGIVDSVGIMELVSFIEEQYKIKIADHEITPEHFDSINRLARYLQSKGVGIG